MTENQCNSEKSRIFKKMATVSIKDIAREVGVSTTTVSFVLNGKAKEKRISEELKDKVLSAAQRLNYRPNQVARGLRTGQSHTLGLIVEDISNPFFAHLARHVEHEADKYGYTVMFCSTENDDKKAAGLLYMLRHRQMDGFIIIPTPGMRQDLCELVAEKKPLVLVDRYFPDVETCHVTVDNYMGAHDAIKLLIEKKYRKIGLVTLNSSQTQMKERELGYLEAMAEHGRVVTPEMTLHVPFDTSDEQTVSTIMDWLAKNPEIDAIFFTTNYLGVAGLDAIRRSGRRIKDDLGVICFDDSILFRLGSPTVTAIVQPIREMGRQAVRMIIDMILKKQDRVVKQTFAPVIVEREST
jgi:LacI family transcriptional regulator